MSQDISVKLVDENNNVEKSFNLDLCMFIHQFGESIEVNKTLKKPERFKMILSIDPYGNTLFNRQQCSMAIDELKELSNEKVLSDYKSDIKRLIDILSSAQLHEYILFEGD